MNDQPDPYPGYRFIVRIAPDRQDSVAFVERLFAEHGLDARCPGAIGWAGVLIRESHYDRAMELLRSFAPEELRRRYVLIEDDMDQYWPPSRA